MTLTLPVIVIAIAAGLFILEGLFFLYCTRWLASGKKLREREFARLDSERAELLELQQALAHDVAQAKQLAQETLGKLNKIGADAHAEWNDMASKIDSILGEVEKQTADLLAHQSTLATKHRLALEKACKDGVETNAMLNETLRSTKKILKFFDKNIPTEQIVKDIQAEKYSDARKMIEQGVDASAIAKKLGISHSEVALLVTLK